MQMSLLAEPDSRLHVRSEAVLGVDGAVAELISDMFETMYAFRGIGLAAPQVDVRLRVIVTDVSPGENTAPNPIAMVNPEIVWVSDHDAQMREGCLSVMGHFGDVSRPAEVRVSFYTFTGNPRNYPLGGGCWPRAFSMRWIIWMVSYFLVTCLPSSAT